MTLGGAHRAQVIPEARIIAISGRILGDTSGMKRIFASFTNKHLGIVPPLLTIGALVQICGIGEFMGIGISPPHRGRHRNFFMERVNRHLGVANSAQCVEGLLAISGASRENILEE